MSLSHDLCRTTLDRIQERFDLAEVTGPDGGPREVLMSGGAPVGALRVLHGGPVHKLVYIGLTVPPIGLDSHMLFAFTAPDSIVPHFTLDSVQAPAGPPGPDTPTMNAFHLDLIPRVDLPANLAYVDAAYAPLTPAYEDAQTIDGLSAAHLSRRQWAMMSPWMLAHRATPDAFVAVGKIVDRYLDHWFGLVTSGVAADRVADPAGRDRAHRAALFSPDVDPVWAQVSRLVGDDVSERLRLTLVAQDL